MSIYESDQSDLYSDYQYSGAYPAPLAIEDTFASATHRYNDAGDVAEVPFSEGCGITPVVPPFDVVVHHMGRPVTLHVVAGFRNVETAEKNLS